MKYELSKQEKMRLFAAHYGQKIVLTKEWSDGMFTINIGDCVDINAMTLLQMELGHLEGLVLLTQIDNMSDEEVLSLCQAAFPAVFGDYRFDKWRVIDRSDNDDTYIKVGREQTREYFTVNKGTGEVVVWETGWDELKEPSFWALYHHLGIAVPLFVSPKHKANGMTAIQMGIGLDRRELNNISLSTSKPQ